MEDILPDFYDVLQAPTFGSKSIGVKRHKIDPANNNQAGLNNKQELTFRYTGDSTCIRLHPKLTGFRVRAAFRTRVVPAAGADQAAVNAANTASPTADITLANNWFWHLFDTIKLKVLNQNDLETVSYPGEYMDIMSHFLGETHGKYYGQLSGWLKDSGSGLANAAPFTATSVATAGANNAPPTVATTITTSAFNAGYQRRKDMYNYTTADGVRHIEQFFPIFPLSGFLGSDTCLMNTSFDLTLIRKGRGQHLNSIFGAASTNIIFADTGADVDTGLISVSLELVEQIPEKLNKTEDQLMTVFANTHKVPKPTAFLKATCTSIEINNSQNFTKTETIYRVPRFVFIGLKGKGEGTANQFDRADANYSHFAHANIESMQVTINGTDYPSFKQDANFLQGYYSDFYQQYNDVCESLPFGGDPTLTMKEFKELYPIFAFNCEHQIAKLSDATTNLKIEIKRRALPGNNNDRSNPLNLTAYLIVLEDRFVTLNTVQGKCEIVTSIVNH